MTTATQKTKSADGRPPRKDVYFVTINELKVIPDFNVRTDMGDLDELARSIEANGILIPLRGYKKDGAYYITNGHRRFEAAKMLAKKGIEIRLPIMPEGHQISEEQRVIDMLVCNDGKRLNPIEEAEAISRLIAYGYSDSEISKKTGFTKVYISNLKLLISAPKKLKDLISNNVVSATLTMKVLREEKDFSKAQQIIESAIVTTEGNGGKKKITQKDINKQKGKVNSYSALKKTFKLAEKKKLVPREDKAELIAFVKSINDGQYSFDNLISELFHPEVTETENTDNQLAIDSEQENKVESESFETVN